MFADINSQSKLDNRDLESVAGLSSIMDRSAFDASERRLVDDDDILHTYNDIKELFRQHAFNFEDLLAKMGKAEFQRENQVTFKDFETLVKNLPGGHKFSSQQLRQVFLNYSQGGASTTTAFIPLIEFKDKFYPGLHYQRH